MNVTTGQWAHAYARRAGPGKTCADWAGCRVIGETLYAAVSDGAGSAPCSYLGSMVAVTTFLGAAPQRLASDGPAAVLTAIQDVVALTAKDQNVPIDDLACTLVAAAVGPEKSIFMQVGDGAAVFRIEEGYETAIIPDQGEFLNTTYFVTMTTAHEHLKVREVIGSIQDLALFTDGIQGLVLHPGTDAPHEAFFQTVFRNIRAPQGNDSAAEAWLSNMLASEMVTNRTDDDTSIVVARRT
ncbi:PP2C family serine/threonine-protein phosphatase [Fimbriimonas ginsengisoli]|uniref:Serine/threonine phosphoprotein phosphatase n=1 Tax=Fimbriimonas ginsengisoli Gsoil 348 TaxID=661478 RepID=A0A068NQ99_FIMGI|nr:PP2C family serine/threonine-protein phosphatase [Fimbriimonas ginsengisoli]AIE84935.1 serine/threonine phosphoprotein phosphatase [Fimbriimonas ginsengisoli Gsoil 348]